MKKLLLTLVMLVALVLSACSTVTPKAVATVFQDDFSDAGATAAQWEEGAGNWEVINGEYVLTGAGWLNSYAGDVALGDYTLSLDLMATDVTDKTIKFRYVDGATHYGLNFRSHPVNDIVLAKIVNGTLYSWITSARIENKNGVWYSVRVELDGAAIRVYVNDQLLIDHVDDAPIITNGRIAIGGGLGGPTSALNWDNVAIEVEVANQPPVAAINAPSTGVTGAAITFDGTGSSDTDGSIVSYDWDFGDGQTGGGDSIVHVYAAEGTYTVNLTVTDDEGATDVATFGIGITDEVVVVERKIPFDVEIIDDWLSEDIMVYTSTQPNTPLWGVYYAIHRKGQVYQTIFPVENNYDVPVNLRVRIEPDPATIDWATVTVFPQELGTLQPGERVDVVVTVTTATDTDVDTNRLVWVIERY